MPVLRDFVCFDCELVQEEFADIKDAPRCNSCGKPTEHVWLSPPGMNTLGAERSDSSIKAMQQSFKERFVKKEIDDVRHKHGVTFDQSLASAAVQRIKEAKKTP